MVTLYDLNPAFFLAYLKGQYARDAQRRRWREAKARQRAYRRAAGLRADGRLIRPIMPCFVAGKGGN